MILEHGYWAGLTLYPQTKISPQRAVDIIERYGPDRICVAGACDWGPSDPVAVPRFVDGDAAPAASRSADPARRLREPGALPQPVAEVQAPADGRARKPVPRRGRRLTARLHPCRLDRDRARLPPHLLHEHPSRRRLGGGLRQPPAVRAGAQGALSPAAPFGLGLRLSARDARELLEGDRLAEFRAFLDDEGLYVAHHQRFPHGSFHGTRQGGRLRPGLARRRARALHARSDRDPRGLLPDGIDGGVSTAPALLQGVDGGGRRRRRWRFVTRNVVRVADDAGARRDRTGGVHPPRHRARARLPARNHRRDDRLLRTAAAPVGAPRLAAALGIRRGRGAANAARPHPDLLRLLPFRGRVRGLRRARSNGSERPASRIGRVQLSSALRRALPGRADAAAQWPTGSGRSPTPRTCIRSSSDGTGQLRHFPDLGDALPRRAAGRRREWRIHFHVPLFTERIRRLGSTQGYVRDVLDAMAAHRRSPAISRSKPTPGTCCRRG